MLLLSYPPSTPPSTPPPPPLQPSFPPLQPLASQQQSTDFGSAGYSSPGPGPEGCGSTPELQRALLSQQQMLCQQAGGFVTHTAPAGLLVATPAQTLTDTLDDIMAGVCVCVGESLCR